MRKYLVKRLLLSVVILFFVTFIIYLLMRCMPSSYVENMARQLSQAPGSKPYEEWLAQLNAQYGLDLGLIPGFFVQLKNLCTGNFGDSWKYTVPVIQKFNEVIWVSFIMGAISLVFELLIAVPLGIVAATKQYSVTDYTVTTVALLGMSLPTFFFATLLKLIFCIKLRWFDLVGLTGRDFNSLSQFGQILDMAKHLVLPIVTRELMPLAKAKPAFVERTCSRCSTPTTSAPPAPRVFPSTRSSITMPSATRSSRS